MNNDYYYSGQYDRKPKKRSWIVMILDMVALLLSCIAFVAMSLTLVTSFYDPSISWIFPTLGLISPAVYLATTLLALYWIIRWRWRVAVPLLLPLVIGIPSISRYYKLEYSKTYKEPSTRGAVKLMSYNVKHFISDEGQASTDDLLAYVEERDPDIVCFQEFSQRRFQESDESTLFDRYNSVVTNDLAIFSRYDILLSSENIVQLDEPYSGSGSAVWADILISEDTIRLYNLHLHSTTITGQDNEYISNMEFIKDSLSDDKFKGMLSRFRDTSIGRAAQADTIAHSIKQSPYKVIVCGDFNDTPNSYVYRKISHKLNDTFQEAGRGYSHTYRGFMDLLRIDYIFVARPIEVISYEVADSVKHSDHLPVETILKL